MNAAIFWLAFCLANECIIDFVSFSSSEFQVFLYAIAVVLSGSQLLLFVEVSISTVAKHHITRPREVAFMCTAMGMSAGPHIVAPPCVFDASFLNRATCFAPSKLTARR
jgi:hypothetical protein